MAGLQCFNYEVLMGFGMARAGVAAEPFLFSPNQDGKPLEAVDVAPRSLCVVTPFKSTALPLRNMYLNHCATISWCDGHVIQYFLTKYHVRAVTG
jgi:prepilin-type processing-associated H-X9-DG protein